MFIQYNKSDGDIVVIQATNSRAACPISLSEQGRGQYEVTDDIDINSMVNIITGEIISMVDDGRFRD